MGEEREFRRPKIKPIDFIPFYGLYTYATRMDSEINSPMDFLKYLYADTTGTFRSIFRPETKDERFRAIRSLISIGTSEWPTDPKYRKETMLTAIQNPLMASYHTMFWPYVILHALI